MHQDSVRDCKERDVRAAVRRDAESPEKVESRRTMDSRRRAAFRFRQYEDSREAAFNYSPEMDLVAVG